MGPEAGAHERSLIQLVGIGPLPPGFAEELAVRVSRRVAVPCQVRQTPSQTELRRVPGRDQVDADWLLGLLEARPLPAGAVAMGITALDLAIPIFTFVFGRARESGHAALVSAARLAPEFYGLAPDAALTRHRTVLEVLHELAHVGGLRHCPDAACLMSFAGSVERVDVRGVDFCPTCLRDLPRWLHPGGGEVTDVR